MKQRKVQKNIIKDLKKFRMSAQFFYFKLTLLNPRKCTNLN